uniref:Acyl-coenzyme A thioesterase 13 n=1 Tax=Steinernema glaseri TaxID=37863 RepID=A0A1I7YPR3_9BILA
MSSLAKNINFARLFIKNLPGMKNFNRVAGECRILSIEEGRVRVELEVTADQLNSTGRLHGGCTSTLADIFTTAALMATPRGLPGATVDLHVSCTAPAKLGETIIIDSQVVKSGRSMGFTRAEFFRKSDNVPIAMCLHSKAFPPEKKE